MENGTLDTAQLVGFEGWLAGEDISGGEGHRTG